MKLMIALIVWLASNRVAFARIKPYVETDPPRARAEGDATGLRVSLFPDQRLGEQHYDLYCPHTIEPNPLIVVAPDLDQPLEDAEGMAGMLARAGFIVIALAPPRAATRYPAALQAVLDQAVQALPEDREPGCKLAGPIGAWGFRSGGNAVLALAQQREASGRPLAGVVASFVVETGVPVPALTTPALVIEGARAATLGDRALVIQGAEACALRRYNDPCHAELDPHAPVEQRQRDGDLDQQRSSLIYLRTKQFLQAHVGGSEPARAIVAGWGPEVVVQPSSDFLDSISRATYAMVSVPLVLGGTNQGNNGLVIGVRPELVIGRLAAERALNPGTGHGIGLYGELSRENGRTVVGGGATLVSYQGGFAIAPSAGVFSRTIGTGRDTGYVLGVFLGRRHRAREFEILDLPLGVRLDYRKTAAEGSVAISLQYDLAIPALVALAFSAIGRHD
jgi:hypothetical protein